MSFENLKLPKKVKKKKLIGKIKDKNRSNVTEDENFKEKIKLFNRQLEFIFSESEADEKRNMIAYTSLLNKDEFETFIDEEGKERMEIDWSSGEFSDSDEEITIDKGSVVADRKKKWKDRILKSRKIDSEIENVTNLTDRMKNKLPIKKWKKQATKFFKKSKKIMKDDTESSRTEEPIYEEIQYKEHRLDQKEEPKYAKIKQLKEKSPHKLDVNKVPIPPPLPPLNTMPHKRPTSKSPKKGSAGSTGFTPQFINQRALMHDDYRSARDVMKTDNLIDYNQVDHRSENIEIKRRKLTNLKDDKSKKATFITFKSPKKDDNQLKDKKIAKIGKIGRIDRKTF